MQVIPKTKALAKSEIVSKNHKHDWDMGLAKDMSFNMQ